MRTAVSVTVGALHLLSLAMYLGGAIAMELMLRHAQEDLPGSQTAITCKVSGDRWRWVALVTLVSTGLSRVALSFLEPPQQATAAYLAGLVGFGVTWVILLVNLFMMSFSAHPALALRPGPDMPPGEFAQTRQELKRAIERMDRMLRTELALALAMTLFAIVAYGSTPSTP